MPLFIDRLPFHCWTDSTRPPSLSHWTIVLPVVLTEPMLLNPPSVTTATDWVLDTGIRGEAFAWRHHLIQAGINPDQGPADRPHPTSGRVRIQGGPPETIGTYHEHKF